MIFASLHDKLDRIDASLRACTTRLYSLDLKVDKMAQSLDDLNASVADMQTELTAMFAQFDADALAILHNNGEDPAAVEAAAVRIRTMAADAKAKLASLTAPAPTPTPPANPSA